MPVAPVVVQLRVVPLPGKLVRFVPDGHEGFIVIVRVAVGPPVPVPVVVPVPVPVVVPVPVPVVVPVPVPVPVVGVAVGEVETLGLALAVALGETDALASVPPPLEPQADSTATAPTDRLTARVRTGRKIDMSP